MCVWLCVCTLSAKGREDGEVCVCVCVCIRWIAATEEDMVIEVMEEVEATMIEGMVVVGTTEVALPELVVAGTTSMAVGE